MFNLPHPNQFCANMPSLRKHERRTILQPHTHFRHVRGFLLCALRMRSTMRTALREDARVRVVFVCAVCVLSTFRTLCINALRSNAAQNARMKWGNIKNHAATIRTLATQRGLDCSRYCRTKTMDGYECINAPDNIYYI